MLEPWSGSPGEEYTKQIFILDVINSGISFYLFCDIPGQRTYSLKQFMRRYLYEYFGEDVTDSCTYVTHEPRRVSLTFYDTDKGKELATIFRIGHELL